MEDYEVLRTQFDKLVAKERKELLDALQEAWAALLVVTTNCECSPVTPCGRCKARMIEHETLIKYKA